jgi:hypothetical protein
MELPWSPRDLVCRLLSDEGRGGEDEFESFDVFQLSTQGLEGIDGEAGSRDPHLGAGAHGPFQIVTEQLRDVV